MAISLEEQQSAVDAFTALAEAAERGMEEIRREVRAPLVAQALEAFENIENLEGSKVQ